MAATVFVSNQSPAHNYSSASHFGALRFVTRGNYPIFKTNRLTEEIIETLAYSKADDYLLISGSATIAAICMAVWLEMHPRLKLLIYSRADGVYLQRDFVKTDLRLAIERVRDRLKEE